MAENALAQRLMLTVSDVKQYPYCPRIVYYGYLLPQRARPTTFKMTEGKLEHERLADLEERRALRAYGLAGGRRHFDVRVVSERLGLSGLLDMVIEADIVSAEGRVLGQELVPVDFKSSTGRVGLNHKYQLTAYAMLLEETWRRPVRRGFIYLAPLRRTQEVRFTANMRGWVHKALREIRAMITSERKPEPTRVRGRCRECEYRNYCPEVW